MNDPATASCFDKRQERKEYLEVSRSLQRQKKKGSTNYTENVKRFGHPTERTMTKRRPKKYEESFEKFSPRKKRVFNIWDV